MELLKSNSYGMEDSSIFYFSIFRNGTANVKQSKRIAKGNKFIEIESETHDTLRLELYSSVGMFGTDRALGFKVIGNDNLVWIYKIRHGVKCRAVVMSSIDLTIIDKYTEIPWLTDDFIQELLTTETKKSGIQVVKVTV